MMLSKSLLLRLLPPLLVAGIALAVLVSIFLPRGGEAVTPALAGTVLKAGPAPSFRLTDQWGRTVSLAQFRGRPIILTFMQANCTQLCPLVAETIHRSVQELGPEGRGVVVLAVSADPEGDTPTVVRAFSRKHGMLHRWLYLTGARRTLAPIWRSYYLYVAPANAPQSVKNNHTSATYLIDRQGRERVLMGGDPSTTDLQRDLLILSGLPVKPVGAFAVPAPQVGHPAPDITARTLTGTTFTLRSVRGKTVLLNFFATWCHPCRSESPRLANWYQKMRTRGVVVIGVDQLEGRADVLRFARAYHLRYPIVLDPNGNLAASYDVAGLPKSVVVDSRGTVSAVDLGPVTDAYLAQHVASLVTGVAGG